MKGLVRRGRVRRRVDAISSPVDAELSPFGVPGGVVARWQVLLDEADLADQLPPSRAAAVHVVTTTAVGLVVVAAGGVVAGAVALCLVACLPLFAFRLVRGRRAARLSSELPELVEAVARRLRSGTSLDLALRELAARRADQERPGMSISGDLARLAGAVDAGQPLGDALVEWGRHRPVPGVDLVVRALTLARSGGAPADTLDRVAVTLREREAARREAASVAVQARLSAVVIALAPLGFGAATAASDPRVLSFLFETAPGLGCLVGGAVLDGLGLMWMAHLTRGEP